MSVLLLLPLPLLLLLPVFFFIWIHSKSKSNLHDNYAVPGKKRSLLLSFFALDRNRHDSNTWFLSRRLSRFVFFFLQKKYANKHICFAIDLVVRAGWMKNGHFPFHRIIGRKQSFAQFVVLIFIAYSVCNGVSRVSNSTILRNQSNFRFLLFTVIFFEQHRAYVNYIIR